MFARFTTLEAVLLLVAGLALFGAGSWAAGLGPGWTSALLAAWVLVAYGPLLVRLQDRLLEFYLGSGRFQRALVLAGAIRDSATKARGRDLAEFDVGLVHLARGAPADAARSFGRIEKHLLQERTRLLVAMYQALALLRSAAETDRQARAPAAGDAARAALAAFGEDAQLLAVEAEALLAAGAPEAAFASLERSLALDPDPRDPSPGERHLLFARAALATGRPEAARRALSIAAGLRGETLLLRAARAELAQLAHAS